MISGLWPKNTTVSHWNYRLVIVPCGANWYRYYHLPMIVKYHLKNHIYMTVVPGEAGE